MLKIERKYLKLALIIFYILFNCLRAYYLIPVFAYAIYAETDIYYIFKIIIFLLFFDLTLYLKRNFEADVYFICYNDLLWFTSIFIGF